MHTRGSPERHPPPITPRFGGRLERPPDSGYQWHEETYSREGDLLVRFGVDSGPGRMVARVLLVLLLTQPVSVAFGMEIEEPAAESVSVSDDSGDVAAEATADTADESDVAVDAEVATVDEPVEETTAADESMGDGSGDAQDSHANLGDDADSDVAAATSTEDTSGASGEEGTDEAASGDTEHGDADASGATGDEATSTTSADMTGNGDSEGGSGSGSGGDSDSTAGTDEGESAGGSEETGTTTDETTDNEDTSADDGGGDTGTGNDAADSGTGGEVPSETGVDATTTDEIASSTDDALVPDESVTLAQNVQNKYTFGEGDCTVVADGEFYCVTDGPEVQVSGDPRVYAEKDREGDREIFYFDGTAVKRITNNSYDDFAPVFDEETQRIVWQAMINDRLQVMLYELPTNTTRQLTSGRQNSSNPDISGDTVVWQEWVDTNWEIMMTDVNNNGGAFEVERLTDNAVHDMFPQAYDGLITWQSKRGDSWEVVVYDLRTGKRQTLEKDENTKYENPRFVLLFDSKHDNGDVETVGYNLDTGEMMELGTRSTQIPAAPVTPKKETPDALPREAASSTTVMKVGREDDGGNGDDIVL